MILEKREFRDNSFNTGWLDELIKANEMAEKPDLNLSLICGALNIADNAIQKNFQVYIRGKSDDLMTEIFFRVSKQVLREVRPNQPHC